MHAGASAVGISPAGSGAREGSEGWWHKAPWSAPDFRARVFMLVGIGGAESDWTKNTCSSQFTSSNVDLCMNMGFLIATFQL